LYIKTFREEGEAKIDNVMSVVVDLDNKPVAVSTGKRKKKQIEAKIETAGIALYLKGGDNPAIGTGGDVSVVQQSRVEPAEKSNGFDTKANLHRLLIYHQAPRIAVCRGRRKGRFAR
jgi:hypothetical protein